MENRGFEEEHQSRVEEGTVLLSQPSLRNSRSSSYRPSRGDVFPVSASNPDNHVYEDILPGVEDVSRPSNGPSDRDPGRSDALGRRSVDVVDRVSTGSFDREEIGAAGLRRNLTLPFRRGTGLDSAIASSSVRVTSREKCVRQENAEVAAGIGAPVDDAFSSREIASRTQSSDCRPNRRRRKKDCKHCRSKQASRDHEASDHGEIEAVLKRNRDNEQRVHAAADSTDPDPRNIGIPPPCSPVPTPEQLVAETGKPSTTVFTISEKIEGSPASTMKLIEYERSDVPANLAHSPEIKEDKALIASEKSRNGMRVNSIYSQDRWYAKEPPIFFTDVKEHGSFQRAYSLPVRTQTPSSQNRANLRRSVRGEPPPHPARLRKHRHGWTLHLARPLESSGCTRSLVFLLILVLALLGIGAVALYIVFEPEKLQIIQQYLRSSTNSSSGDDAKTFIFGDGNETTSTTPVSNTLVGSVLSSIDPSFPEISSPTATEPETTAGPSNLNSTRYCDDCLDGEVCVALVDEEVPICRIGLDREDPTGCAGFCLINRQRCHRLDVDAFRCVEVEHYCLDDEWTCSNTLCIPLEKRCDGHMNCYDHSDEYDCVCDQETHFQCGNETSCLQLEMRCDGKIDCWDAADEINCTLGRILGRSCPSENEFTCSDGQCILKDRFCDGLPDCLDGSDEPHGCQGRCNKQEFTCQNSRCITKGMKCNGMDDCGDGSDERHCKDRFS